MASDDSSPGASPEQQKRSSRQKKSTFQLELLEKVYAENKYPSIAFRAGLTKEVGLSEKQLQVWFTHRRRKDRRDGIEHDQLTLHGNHNKSEMQSDEPELVKDTQVNLNGREDVCPKDQYPIATLQDQDDDNDDDVIIIEGWNVMNGSNGKDPKPQDEKMQKPNTVTRGEIMPQPKEHTKMLQLWRPNPEPEAFISTEANELVAIAAVEMQLCEPLREDGPPLGIEFDTLPPGAFQDFTRTKGLHRLELKKGSVQMVTGRAAVPQKSKDLVFLKNKKRQLGDLYGKRLSAQLSVLQGHFE